MTMRWPYDSFQRALGPVHGGDLMFVAGTTGNGKTVLAQNLSWSWARRGIRVHYIALESGNLLPYWFAGLELGVSRFRMRTNSEAKADVLEYLTQGDYPTDSLIIDDVPFAKADAVLKKVRKTDAQVVVIDHLAAIDYGGTSERREIGQFVRRLKIEATDSDVPVFAIQQMGRGERQRGAAYLPPKLDDLFGSSFQEHTADVVFGIFRKLQPDCGDAMKQYVKGLRESLNEYEDGMGIRVLKARHGARERALRLAFEMKHGYPTEKLLDDVDWDVINKVDRGARL